jgi:hypothetical protein
MRAAAAIMSAAIAAVTPAAAQTLPGPDAPHASEAQPPSSGKSEAPPPRLPSALTIVRYDEDWSVLADPATRTGRWTDALKYIPLGSEGASYLTT